MSESKEAVVDDGRLSLKYWLLLLLMVGYLCFVTYDSADRFLERPMSGDFKHFYYAAYGVAHDQNIYTSGYPFTGAHWYAYMPLFAIVLWPLVGLGLDLGEAGAAWSVINALLISMCVFIGVRESVTRLGMKATPKMMVGVAFVVFVVFVDKIRGEIRLGQSDAFVLIWMMLGLMWIGKRPILAGIMLGGAVNVKLQGLVFLPYLIARGRIKNLIGYGLGTAFFALIGAAIWGFERNLMYLGNVLGWVGDLVGIKGPAVVAESELCPLEWERSLTIPSVLKRAQLHWEMNESVVMLGIAAMLVIIVAIGWGMYVRRGVPLLKGRMSGNDDRSEKGRGLVGLEWGGLIVGMLIFSPQSTVRHFLLSMIVVAMGSAILHSSASRRRKMPVLISMIAFWAAITFPPGGERYADQMLQWRSIGGAMWAMLALYLCVLWAGLGIVRELPGKTHKANGATV